MSIASLPLEPQDEILKSVSCQDVGRLCSLDRAHRNMCNTKGFWEHQYELQHDKNAEQSSPAFPSVWNKTKPVQNDFARECRFERGRKNKQLTLESHGNMYNYPLLTYSSDGTRLVLLARGHQQRVTVWDVPRGYERVYTYGPGNFRDPRPKVRCCALSPNGQVFAMIISFYDPLQGGDRLCWFDTATMQGNDSDQFQNESEPMDGHYTSMIFSPDNHTIALISTNYIAVLFDIRSNSAKVLHPTLTEVDYVQFLNDGSRLILCNKSPFVHLMGYIYNVETGASSPVHRIGGRFFGSMCAHPDGEQIVLTKTSGDLRDVVIWNVLADTTRSLTKFTDEYTPMGVYASPDGHSFAVLLRTEVGMNRNGSAIALLRMSELREFGESTFSTTRLFVQGIEQTDYIDHHIDPTPSGRRQVQFTPDGRFITAIVRNNNDSMVRVWDAATGVLIKNIATNRTRIVEAAISPDSKCIVVALGGVSKSLQVWRL